MAGKLRRALARIKPAGGLTAVYKGVIQKNKKGENFLALNMSFHLNILSTLTKILFEMTTGNYRRSSSPYVNWTTLEDFQRRIHFSNPTKIYAAMETAEIKPHDSQPIGAL